MRGTFKKGLIGLKYKDFLNAFIHEEKESAEIMATEARLIPLGKKDDEMALTTVFLSAIRLIKEYRNLVSEILKLSKAGQLFCFTEVSFPSVFSDDPIKKNCRFDGLVLVVSGGIIKDVAIFEMKTGFDELNKKQMETYIDMAHILGIKKLMSISNQFVPSENIYPIELDIPKKNKDVILYHSSWKRIMTLGKILIQHNNLNIEDIDQQLLMSEVVRYMSDCGSIRSFDKMGKEWKDVASDLGSLSETLNYKLKDDYEKIVRDWIQEERDIAIDLTLLLSELDFTPVYADSKKCLDFNNMVKESLQILKDTRQLNSIYKIKNGVSDLKVSINFISRKITQLMTISLPTDKTVKGKLNYVRSFFKKAEKADPNIFKALENQIIVLIIMKRKQDNLKFSLSEFMDVDKSLINNNSKIIKIEVQMETDLTKRDFENSSKFILLLENSVYKFYVSIMQYFEKWTPPTPKVKPSIQSENVDEIETDKEEA